MSNEKFVAHKNVPGPQRLQLEKADNSGKVNSDPQFIADRQAIDKSMNQFLLEGSRNFRVRDQLMSRFGETTDL